MTIRPAKLFSEYFGDATAAVVARAPGRVNLVGDHTEYNEGFVLPTIIDRNVEAVVRRRPDRKVRLAAADFDEVIETTPGEPIDFDGPGWAPYVFGIVRMLEQRGKLTSGIDIVIRGTVPRGAGLGSSAALELAVVLALDGIFNLWLEPIEMAKLCHEVEHRFVGIRSSIMDQLVCRLGKPGSALAIDCRTLDARHIPLPFENHRLVIVDSGIRSEPDDSDFEERHRECREALKILQAIDPSIHALRDLSAPKLAANHEHLSPLLFSRCRHVVEENLRVAEASEILPTGDLSGFGRLMTISHQSLHNDFDASHPVLDRLVACANKVDGVLGSRLTGSGFGGCTVHLVTAKAVQDLEDRLQPILDELPDSSLFVVGAPSQAGVVEVVA